MTENIKLRFFRNTRIPENPNQGDIVFNPQTKRISICTNANDKIFEEYGGEVQNAVFENGQLTITKKDGSSFTLDFSDVASATDVSKVVGGLKETVSNQGNAIAALDTKASTLRTDVDQLQKEVEGDSETTGLLDRVTALEGATGSGTGGLADLNNRLTTAEGEIDTLQTNVAALENNKANKSDVYTKSETYSKDEINSKLSSAYKAQGSKTAAGLTRDLLIAANEGYVYNISDKLTITDSNRSLFVEGVQDSYIEGTNVVVVNVGGAYKFDVIAGFVDLTAYAKTADQQVITDALSGRITTLEGFKDGTGGYQYVKNVDSSHTNSTTSGAPTNMISVSTSKNDSTGIVTVNINESNLDTKLKAMDEAISNADAAAKAGVLSLGGKTGAIDVRSGSKTVADVNFTVTQESEKNAILKGTVVRPSNADKVDNYKAGGNASTPVYISDNGTPTVITIESTEAANGGANLVTSGAAFKAITKAINNNNETLNTIH